MRTDIFRENVHNFCSRCHFLINYINFLWKELFVLKKHRNRMFFEAWFHVKKHVSKKSKTEESCALTQSLICCISVEIMQVITPEIRLYVNTTFLQLWKKVRLRRVNSKQIFFLWSRPFRLYVHQVWEKFVHTRKRKIVINRHHFSTFCKKMPPKKEIV